MVDRLRYCVFYVFVVYNKFKDVKLSGDIKLMQWILKFKFQIIFCQLLSGNEVIWKLNREVFEKRVVGLY